MTQIPLSLIGMLLFVVTFIGITIACFLRRHDLHALAQMPLREDDHE